MSKELRSQFEIPLAKDGTILASIRAKNKTNIFKTCVYLMTF